MQDHPHDIGVRARRHRFEETACDNLASVVNASPFQNGFRLIDNMRLIEQRTAHPGMGGKNASKRLALSAANVNDVSEHRKVVSLDQMFDAAARKRGHRLIKNLILRGVFRTVLPNRFAVKIGKGIFTGLDTVKKMTPRLPDIRPSDKRRPRADRRRRIRPQAIADLRERAAAPLALVENAGRRKRAQQTK